MRLEVPFFKQTTALNCGPVALRMVLAYFGNDISQEILDQRTGIKQGKGTLTIQIATAVALSGYKAEFFSKNIYFNEENLKLEFYQKYMDEIQRSKQLVEDAKNAGVKMEEKTLDILEILEKVNKDCLPIVLLDWNAIIGKEKQGYQGHFVPIVGYDDVNVYVHNHGFDGTAPFMKIRREIFDKARKSQGTDEDILFIRRN